MTLVYLDLETTGLDPDLHQVWEIGWAVDDGPIRSAFVQHSLSNAHPDALKVSQYGKRIATRFSAAVSQAAEDDLRRDLTDATVVGANPAFDAAFLRARWGVAPWHYRLLDVEAFALGLIDPRASKVPGLNRIAKYLRTEHGATIPVPDHTAAGDVATLRACHQALIELCAARPTSADH